jgi:hypothetical protein
VKDFVNVLGLLILGLVVIALAKQPTAIKAFFGGLQGTLGLLTK